MHAALYPGHEEDLPPVHGAEAQYQQVWRWCSVGLGFPKDMGMQGAILDTNEEHLPPVHGAEAQYPQ